MPNIESWLARKYQILGQEAAARANAANAEANVNNTRAGLLPAESGANVGLTRAQTRSVDENTKFIKPLADASVFNTTAQGSLFGQQAVGEYQLNRLSKTLAGKKTGASSLSFGLPSFSADFDKQLQSILKEGLGY